jgi:hypothetical protein
MVFFIVLILVTTDKPAPILDFRGLFAINGNKDKSYQRKDAKTQRRKGRKGRKGRKEL